MKRRRRWSIGGDPDYDCDDNEFLRESRIADFFVRGIERLSVVMIRTESLRRRRRRPREFRIRRPCVDWTEVRRMSSLQ